MAKTVEYKGFKIGERVVINTIAHSECENVRPYIGQHGVIVKIAKTRNIIWVMCDIPVKGYENSRMWGAYPENLSKE